MKTTKLAILTLCAALSLSLSCTISAQPEHTDSLIKERKKGFKMMGRSMRAMGKMLKSGDIDVAKVATSVEAIKQQSLALPGWFEQESSNQSYKTDALPAIWRNKEDFDKKAKALQLAASEVESMLKKDDFQLKTALKALKKTCGSCHDKYKAD